jgi:hypothetical protein
VHKARRQQGRGSTKHKKATSDFRAACRQAKAAFITGLESLRIGQPREFYQLLRKFVPPVDIQAETLSEHYT